MIVQCDKCGAKFALADEKITDKGAKVRCSKCKAVFTVKKSPDAAGPAEEAGQAPAKASPKDSAPGAAPPPPPPPKSSGIAAGKEPDPFSDFNFSDDLDFSEGDDEKLTVAPPKPKPAPPPPPPPPAPPKPAPAAPKPAPAPAKPAPPPPPPPPAAPPAPPAPAPSAAPDFMDDAPTVSFSGTPGPTAAPPEPGGGEEGGFDFPEGEDFSFSDEPGAAAPAAAPADSFGDFDFKDEPEPAPPPPPPAPAPAKPAPAKPPAAKPAAKGGGPATDDFGDFKFDDDSFGEAPAASPGGPPPPEEDWGNVSIGAAAKPGPAASGETTDDTGFGDFQFDSNDQLPGKHDDDLGMDLAKEFVRSPSSKAPVRDDLEASISDTESPPEKKAPAPMTEGPPPPPPPKIVHKSQSGGAGKSLGAIVVLILVIGGGLGGFLFRDKIKAAFSKTPVDNGPRGKVELAGEPTFKKLFRAQDNTTLIVAEGKIKNATDAKQSGILVSVSLSYTDDQGPHQRSEQAYCGATFTEAELKEFKPDELKLILAARTGRDFQCLEVPPGDTRPWTIIFFDVPSNFKDFKPGKPEIVKEKEPGPANPP